jgi:hypothetical protein
VGLSLALRPGALQASSMRVSTEASSAGRWRPAHQTRTGRSGCRIQEKKQPCTAIRHIDELALGERAGTKGCEQTDTQCELCESRRRKTGPVTGRGRTLASKALKMPNDQFTAVVDGDVIGLPTANAALRLGEADR